MISNRLNTLREREFEKKKNNFKIDSSLVASLTEVK